MSILIYLPLLSNANKTGLCIYQSIYSMLCYPSFHPDAGSAPQTIDVQYCYRELGSSTHSENRTPLPSYGIIYDDDVLRVSAERRRQS